MQIVRTVIWTIVLVGLFVFSLNNWEPVTVKIWENLVLETKLPVLVLISFFVGLVPMWLLHRGVRWRFNRRISALEKTVQAAVAPHTIATTTQLDEAARNQ